VVVVVDEVEPPALEPVVDDVVDELPPAPPVAPVVPDPPDPAGLERHPAPAARAREETTTSAYRASCAAPQPADGWPAISTSWMPIRARARQVTRSKSLRLTSERSPPDRDDLHSRGASSWRGTRGSRVIDKHHLAVGEGVECHHSGRGFVALSKERLPRPIVVGRAAC
jgi:hypothetical protein